MSADGLVTLASDAGPAETLERLSAAVRKRGMSIVARIDHASAGARAGLELRPTEVLIFGNPRAGTPLMQAAQTAGLDLPLKALVWQDAAGKTWLSYNDPRWLAQRHGIGELAAIGGMAASLEAVAAEAIGGPEAEA